MNIPERIAATESKLAGMKAERGAALLDGKRIAAGDVAALEAEIDALQDAQAEEVRRERESAASKRLKRQTQLKDAISELERERIAALTEAEEFARSYVSATKRALDITAREALAVYELLGRVPTPLSSLNVENRLSLWLSAVLKLLKKAGPNRRFGFIDLPNTLEKPEAVWAVEEAKQTESTIQEIRA